jgi:hypothetical protein
MSRTSPGSAPVVAATLALLAACAAGPANDGASGDAGALDGGADVCVETAVTDFPDLPLGGPSDLPLEGVSCVPGGLAGVDLGGRWLATTTDAFTFELPVIRDSCEAGLEIDFRRLDGGEGLLIHRDDSDLFWSSRFSFGEDTVVNAFHACVDGDTGDLALVSGVCFNDTCAARPGRLRRFARPPGEVEAAGLELVSEWRGGAAPWRQGLTYTVQVLAGRAYVARIGELRIVDVADPAAPRDLGVFTAENDSRHDFNDVKVFIADGRTYAVLAADLTAIVDVTDPASPVQVASLDTYSHTVFLRSEAGRTLAYLGTFGTSVPIYDLADPAAPALVEDVELPSTAGVHDLFATADRLYVNARTDGFIVMHDDGDDWTMEGQLPTSYSHASWVGQIGGRTIAIHGDEGLGARLQVVDVTPGSPSFMTALSSYQPRPEASVSVHNMELVGSRAFVAHYQDGVRVLDLSDPTAPALVAYHHTFDLATSSPDKFEGAIGIDVDPATGLIYVADTARGLLIFRETP